MWDMYNDLLDDGMDPKEAFELTLNVLVDSVREEALDA